MGLIGRGLEGKTMNSSKSTDVLTAPKAEPNGEDQVARLMPIASTEKPAEGTKYDWMGPSLRRMYDDVLNEPIPDSFVELLKQLHEQQKKKL
jgi:ABC-type uncharacterized transport system YnjBCD substrate-binding protein